MPEISAPKPEEAIPALRDILEIHRTGIGGRFSPDMLFGWMKEENPEFDPQKFGFQEFTEFLNFAQDKLVVRLDADEDKGLTVFLGAEFYPPAPPPQQEQEVFSDTMRNSRSWLVSLQFLNPIHRHRRLLRQPSARAHHVNV